MNFHATEAPQVIIEDYKNTLCSQRVKRLVQCNCHGEVIYLVSIERKRLFMDTTLFAYETSTMTFEDYMALFR